MKLSTIITIAAMAVATSVCASAKDKSSAAPQVNVYCNHNRFVSAEGEGVAKDLSGQMFAKIGVNLK